MPVLSDFLGSKCPVCAKDILQRAPSIARMPPGEYAYCHTCESALSVNDLSTLMGPKRGILAKIFGRKRATGA